jgi:hypothetical protein
MLNNNDLRKVKRKVNNNIKYNVSNYVTGKVINTENNDVIKNVDKQNKNLVNKTK